MCHLRQLNSIIYYIDRKDAQLFQGNLVTISTVLHLRPQKPPFPLARAAVNGPLKVILHTLTNEYQKQLQY